MATVTLTPLYGSLDSWPGNLLTAEDDTVVTTRTASTFGFTYGSSSDSAGYKVVVTGTAFTYLDGVPISGTMSAVKIVNASGATVAKISGLSGVIPSDFDQFYASVFGSRLDGNGPGPDGRTAWSLLTLGKDVINGTASDDWNVLTSYNQGDDTLNMFGGDDEMRGDIGNDTYNGGRGFDRLTFFDTGYNTGSNLLHGITVNVGARTVRDPWGGTDRFTSIEQFEGSRFNDVFKGSADTQDNFTGIRGNDTFRGGQVSINGSGHLTSDNNDSVSYNSDYWNGGRFGIVVKLQTSVLNGSIQGTIRDGFGNTDKVFDIEVVGGTRYNDRFTGSRAENIFAGGEGTDSFAGGGGTDRVSFDYWTGNNAPHGISVDLRKASGQIIDDGFGNTETVKSIEEISGTDGGDLIIMNGTNNQIQAEDGKDAMTGGGGQDTFFFISQREANDGDRITDFVSGVDNVTFDSSHWENMTTTIRLVNGTAATTSRATAVFNSANHTLYWDPDGTGPKAMFAVVQLTGVDALTSDDVMAY